MCLRRILTPSGCPFLIKILICRLLSRVKFPLLCLYQSLQCNSVLHVVLHKPLVATVTLPTVFLPARTRSSSAPTCSTFTPSAAASPTAPCGSPSPLWTTAPWRACSSASSPSENCIWGRGKLKGRGRRPLRTLCSYHPTRRKTGIRSDEEQKLPFYRRSS